MSYDDPQSVQDLVRKDQVHRDVYINQDIFAEEMKHLFSKTWVYIGHASQIPNEGDYYNTTLGTQPVIMVRHSDGDIKVLYNRCPHKGVQVVSGTDGNAGRYFRCPYHAWLFKTDGSPFVVPVKKGYKNTEFQESCAAKGMTQVADVHVYRDFVFAKLSEGGIGFDEYFGQSLSSIDNMVERSPEGRLEVVGSPLRYMHHCNWKMLVENQTDTFHAMVAHESSAGTVKEIWEENKTNGPVPMAVEVIVPFTSSYDFCAKMGIRTWDNGHGHTGVNTSIHADYTLDSKYHTLMAEAYGEDRAKEILKEARHNTIYFPNMMIKGPIQLLRLFKPIAADKTLVESWIFRLVGAPDELLERTAMYNRLINAPTSIVGHDDLEMYERAQRGLTTDGNQWVNLQRAYDENEVGTGPQEFEGTSEVQMRNQFRAWKKFINPDFDESNANGDDQ